MATSGELVRRGAKSGIDKGAKSQMEVEADDSKMNSGKGKGNGGLSGFGQLPVRADDSDE